MDAYFGIVVQVDQAEQMLLPLPAVERRWGGQTYPPDELRFRFSDCSDFEVSMHDVSKGIRERLPEHFQSGEWRFLSIDSHVLDQYLFELRTQIADDILAPSMDSGISLEHSLGALLSHLGEWAVVFAWQSEYVAEVVSLDIPQVLLHLRHDILQLLQSSGDPKGFVAVSNNVQLQPRPMS